MERIDLRTRRTFTKQFKENAVKWSEVIPANEVARACAIDVTLLHHWRRDLLPGPKNEGHPRYTKEFKIAVVQRLQRGEPARKVARASGVKLNSVRRWLYEFRKYGDNAFAGYGKDRSYIPSTRIVHLTFTEMQYARIKELHSLSPARTLPDFVRAQVLRMDIEPTPEELETRLDQLTRVVQNLAQKCVYR